MARRRSWKSLFSPGAKSLLIRERDDADGHRTPGAVRQAQWFSVHALSIRPLLDRPRGAKVTGVDAALAGVDREPMRCERTTNQLPQDFDRGAGDFSPASPRLCDC